MKIGIFLSVRNKSTRYPGKVLLTMGGKTVTEILLGRLLTVGNADGVFLATSPDPRDTVLAEIAQAMDVPAFRGDPIDKLKRYLDGCDHFGLDGCVVVDGDDTLCMPEYLEQTVADLKTGKYDFVAYQDLPLGAIGFGVLRRSLARIMALKSEEDTEVWGHYFTKNPVFTCHLPPVEDPLFRHPEIRLTLDYPEDFELFERIHKAVGPGLESKAIMELLVERRPELAGINAEAHQRYLANLAAPPASQPTGRRNS